MALDLLGEVDVREGDSHVWLDPQRHAAIIERLTELARGQAAAKLAADLEALDREYARGLADCERREFVTAHDAFGYLAERYDSDVIPIAASRPSRSVRS